MSAFKDDFTIMGLRHVRRPKPDYFLRPQSHHELKLPDPIGKVHLDLYTNERDTLLFGRLVRMSDGEVAWYQIIEADGKSLTEAQ